MLKLLALVFREFLSEQLGNEGSASGAEERLELLWPLWVGVLRGLFVTPDAVRGGRGRWGGSVDGSESHSVGFLSKSLLPGGDGCPLPGGAAESWRGGNLLRQGPGDCSPGGAHRDGDLADGRTPAAQVGDPSPL